MSLLLRENISTMGTPLFHEFKKHASFFIKEKFKIARLALTDVTPAELMTEEATNGNTGAPDSRTLRSISRAAFKLDDYWRIVEILHKRLLKFDKKNWRASYNSLIVLEHMLTHGPESVAKEFQSDKDVINQIKSFQYIDDSGFNWGLTVRKKSERILKLLQEGNFLKEERNRARRLSIGIQGFGSFSQWSTQAQGILREKPLPTTFGRCNSDFNSHVNQENQSFSSKMSLDIAAVKSPSPNHEGGILKSLNSVETKSHLDNEGNDKKLHESETSSKENMSPSKEEFHFWNLNEESNSLLDGSQEDDSRLSAFMEEDNDHPFNSTDMHATSSLLSSR